MVLNRQFGEYVLLRRLAIGGQSEVFLATKNGPGTFTRPVVIKALPSKNRESEQAVRLFYREAFISSRFSHPHVINVHDARVIEDDHCMIMDFVSGQTVADIAQRGYQQACPPTLEQVAQIVADACAGLEYVHEFRDIDNRTYCVVHRDVSPQNLMVTYQGVTMLFDFGIARIIGHEDDDERDGLAGGKYAYMSPEQLEGEPVDSRSDIFSLGIILYELCTGYRLFRRPTPPEVIRAVAEDPIQPPRELREDIPQFLENIILKALARDPLERYQTASRFREDLNQFLDMVSPGNDVRRGLGAYVAGLFKSERAEIAGMLRKTDELGESEPLDGTSLTDLGTDAFRPHRDPTMELAMPRPGQDPAHPAPADTKLKEELERLRKRQTLLYLVLVAVVAIAAVLALQQFGARPTAAQETPTVHAEQ